MSDITINILDPNFERAIRRRLRRSVGAIYQSELKRIKELDVSYLDIKSLQGLEHFTNLEILYCEYNHLTSLDISKNVYLRILWCSNNQLTSLDISNNVDLATLDCDRCVKLIKKDGE